MTDMNSLIGLIVQRIAEVYHMTQESAEAAFRKSRFYSVLNDMSREYHRDDAETNFRRYQNEIEYGAWNQNEFGEIVEQTVSPFDVYEVVRMNGAEPE